MSQGSVAIRFYRSSPMPSVSDPPSLSRSRGNHCPGPAKDWHASSSEQKVTGLPKRFREPLMYLSAFIVMSFILFQQLNLKPITWPQGCPDDDFILAIAQRATPDRFIVLALVDAAFADMAINLYKAHLQPNNIINFLFVGAGRRACEILWNESLPCHHYTEDEDSEVASVYLSRDFIRKMNIRTQMILDALNAGFTVLHTDLDVAFLGNPLPDIKDVLLDADLAALWDSVVFNAGFVAVRPTPFGRHVYETMKKITSRYPKVDDQRAMNIAIARMRRVYEKTGFRAAILDRKRYLCGYDYFEKGDRMFVDENPCEDCIVIHNNWIVSKEAKVYRFKEHLLWMHDKDDYYSSRTRRYLIYDNPPPPPPPTPPPGVTVAQPRADVEELGALRTALAFGELLDRIVILPRFHCFDQTPPRFKECPLNSLINISAFDESFAGKYRENSFLRHPLVPKSTVSSRTQPYHLRIQAVEEQAIGSPVAMVTPPDDAKVLTVTGNMTSDDVIRWFGDVDETVLVFYSLFVSTPRFSTTEQRNEFSDRTWRAFQRSNYRQIKD